MVKHILMFEPNKFNFLRRTVVLPLFLKMKLIYFIILCIISLSFSACKLLLGIKNPRELNKDEIIYFWKEHFDTTGFLFSLDTAKYLRLAYSIKDTNAELAKNLMQPIQIKAYKNNLKILHTVNCFIPGFPNLKWNYSGAFDVYPPNKEKVRNITNFNDIEFELSYLYNLIPQKELNLKNHELFMFVYWNKWMYPRTKTLIEEIKNYKNKFNDKDIVVVYVNMDNIYK